MKKEDKLGQLKSIDILLAEDNLGDADLAIEALEESKMKNRLFTVSDGQEALDFLYKKENTRICRVLI